MKLLILNYNTIPKDIRTHGDDVIIYDQSEDIRIYNNMWSLNAEVIKSKHTGHGLSDLNLGIN